MADQAIKYNLKAVVMETGLKPVTLRAWERRYGLPEPKRTPGKHRLYSQRDIDMLKWLLARQKEGVSISQAVAIWRNIEADGQDPLTAVSPVSGIASVAALPEGFGEHLVEIRQGWIEACLAFDEARIEQIMIQAFARFPAEVICLELLQKGLAELGIGWYEGKVTVQQEHFASAQAMRRLEMLVAAQPPATRPERILVGCAPKDAHTFATLLLTFLLRRHGWDVIYLGADVPTEQLDKTILATEPDLVIFTAAQLFTAVSLISISQFLKNQGVAFAFGGLVFNVMPSLVESIEGCFLGTALVDVPRQVQRIFAGDLELIKPSPTNLGYDGAAEQYDRHRAAIEAAVWNHLQNSGFPASFLSEINNFFGRDISAALKFGNIELLEANLDWLLVLMQNHGWSQEWLHLYMQAYLDAVNEKFLAPQHPLTLWLQEKVNKETQ